MRPLHGLAALLVAAAALPPSALAAPVLVSGDQKSQPVAISDDGRLALFNSEEESLSDQDIDDETDPDVQAYVRDTTTGALELLVRTNDDVTATDMSRDGRFVLFWSAGDDLSDQDADLPRGGVEPYRDVDTFLRDRVAGTTTLVGPGGGGGMVSDDGSVVSFSADERLVPADTDTWRDVYVANLRTGRIALATAGTPRASVGHHALSANGRWLTYTEAPSGAAESVMTAVTRRYDVRTRRSRTIARHRYHPKAYTFHTAVSDDGRRVAFTRYYFRSRTPPEESHEVFLWDARRPRRVRPVGRPGCRGTRYPHRSTLAMSSDGRRIAWAGPRPEDFVDGFEPEEPYAGYVSGPRCRIVELKVTDDESAFREGIDSLALSRNGRWVLSGTSRDNVFAGAL